MSYSEEQVTAAIAVLDKYRGTETGEVGAALSVVGPGGEAASR